MNNNRHIRSLISGGGNQGNILLAVKIADRLKEMNPANEILFIGVKDREEMEIVSKHGYDIVGIPAARIVKGAFMSYVLSLLSGEILP